MKEIKFIRVGGFKDLFVSGEKWENTRGIYAWTRKIGGKISLEYIGKATASSLIKRQLEHMQGYESLNNTLRAEFRSSEDAWLHGFKKNPEFYSIHADIGKFGQVQKEMLSYAHSITIYFSDLTHLSSEEIGNIEKYLIYTYKPCDNVAHKNNLHVSAIEVKVIGDLNLKKCNHN